MRNSDVHDRFEDWLLNPSEALDFEVKGWLDMDSQEHRAAIAKALIALENHGGGFLLIGYGKNGEGALVPDNARPADLNRFTPDEFNGIVKRYAEPAFHVDLTIQTHKDTGAQFPLVIVSGASKVPVRSERSSAENTIRKDIYYVRRPGPASEPPQSGAEWDALIRRCVLKQREEIVSVLRNFNGLAFLGEAVAAPQPGAQQKLMEYVQACNAKWLQLNDSLPPDHPSKIQLGKFVFAARIDGNSRGLKAAQILHLLETGRRYTGWPVFVALHQEKTKPYLADGVLEAWLAHIPHPDVGHADFWRINPDGNFYQLRGLQEDSSHKDYGFGEPGKLFEATLPIWRLGEFLLRIVQVGDEMYEAGYRASIYCCWSGLKGRQLFVYRGHRAIPGYTSQQNEVVTSGEFDAQAIKDLLPATVKALTAPLYEHFEFFQPPDDMYEEELNSMTRGRFP